MVGDPVALRYQDKRGRWKVRQFWQGTRTAFGKVTRGYEENGKPMVDDVPVEAASTATFCGASGKNSRLSWNFFCCVGSGCAPAALAPARADIGLEIRPLHGFESAANAGCDFVCVCVGR